MINQLPVTEVDPLALLTKALQRYSTEIVALVRALRSYGRARAALDQTYRECALLVPAIQTLLRDTDLHAR